MSTRGKHREAVQAGGKGGLGKNQEWRDVFKAGAGAASQATSVSWLSSELSASATNSNASTRLPRACGPAHGQLMLRPR